MAGGAVFLFRVAVLDLSEAFADHDFSTWALDVGFFVALVGYMAWQGIDKKALKESEEMHRMTLANISDSVFITDDELRVHIK